MVLIPVQKVSNGMRLEYKNDVWTIVEFAHVKPGKGGAFVRIKLKSLTSGRVQDVTLQASERVDQTEVSYRRMSYLYKDDTEYVFMDSETYEQLAVNEETLGSKKGFLVENQEVTVLFWKDRMIGIDLPVKVDLRVAETMPANRGNTATNVTKDATLETGLVVQVPLFINEGDVVRIDTRDSAYETRV
jgi:elongation factor P